MWTSTVLALGGVDAGSYVRAHGAWRVSPHLKTDPDDKPALTVYAAAAGLGPAEYVALLVREDGRR